ncbi:MAG: TonB-dependent receptor, partial [Cyclobacteriaceae bacterium]
DITSLQEVVVVGYGTQEKVNVTGAVGTVKAADLVKVPSPNVSEVMIGKVPGLFSMQSQGVPGADYANLSIRGFGEPLVLVDGVQTSWTRIDPNDIESISVLKDASAAIYGARAGNGVILITTKRGTSAEPVISYTGNYTLQQPTTVPEFVSSGQYAEMLHEGELNSALPFTYTEEEIQKFKDGTDPDYVNANWYKAAFKNWAPMQTHNLSVKGGSVKVKYFMSAGYLDQSSIYKSDDLTFRRYNARSNVDVQITDRLSASVDLSYRNETRLAPQTSLRDIWINLKTALPMWSPTLPDPSKGGAYSGFLERSPVAQTHRDMTGFDDDVQQYFMGRFNLKYDVPGIEGMNVNAALNYTVNNTFTKTQDRPFDVLSYDYSADEYTQWGTNGANSLKETMSQYTQLYPMISLNYDRSFGNHSVQGLLLSEWISTDYNFLSAGRVDLLSVEVPYLFAGSPDNLTNNGGAIKTGRASYVGRINYGFKNRYLLEGTFRYDASHKFSPDSRWGFFPSVSAGWRIAEESFIKDNVTWIDDLKIRASYSMSGNDNVEAFKYLTGYEILGATSSVYVFGSDVYRLIRNTGLANPDITWLDMTTYNVGLDATFLNGLIGIEFDLFQRVTDNIFGKPQNAYPSTFGAILPELNINTTEDRGFELTLSHRKNIGQNLNYSVAFMGSLAREKYKSWSESAYDDADEIRIYQRTGKYSNRWIGYLSDGIFMDQSEIDSHPVNQDQADNSTLRPGDIKYIDLNSDGLIDWRDQDEIGYGEFPDVSYGVNLQVQYKGFSLTALFQGASMFNSMISDALRGPLQNLGNPFQFQYKYRWQPDPNNPDVNINSLARLPAVLGDGVGTNTNNNKASDFWLQDATYLRLKNVNLTYAVPSALTDRIGMKAVNVYIAGSNLLTWSKLGIYKSSVDPEMTGYEKFYPPVKTVALGLYITL